MIKQRNKPKNFVKDHCYKWKSLRKSQKNKKSKFLLQNQKNSKIFFRDIFTRLFQLQRITIKKMEEEFLNWSINKNRILPKIEKLKIRELEKLDQLFTKVDKNSKFYREKLPVQLRRYAVANEGQNKLVVLYGDSHAEYSAYRFLELYKNAKEEDRLSELPTLVTIIFHYALLIP